MWLLYNLILYTNFISFRYPEWRSERIQLDLTPPSVANKEIDDVDTEIEITEVKIEEGS